MAKADRDLFTKYLFTTCNAVTVCVSNPTLVERSDGSYLIKGITIFDTAFQGILPAGTMPADKLIKDNMKGDYIILCGVIGSVKGQMAVIITGCNTLNLPDNMIDSFKANISDDIKKEVIR